MKTINQLLGKYKAWDELFDASILVGVEDEKIVFEWREQAEKTLRQKGQGAMTED